MTLTLPVREDPPKPRSRPSWRQTLAVPASDPGHWYLVEIFPDRYTARDASRGLAKGVLRTPPGEWDFAVRRVDGGHGLYARRHPDRDEGPTGTVHVLDGQSFT